MIGIFIDPGVLPTVSAQAQNRFERVFGYDSLSDRPQLYRRSQTLSSGSSLEGRAADQVATAASTMILALRLPGGLQYGRE
jgi:hypothetical protein